MKAENRTPQPIAPNVIGFSRTGEKFKAIGGPEEGSMYRNNILRGMGGELRVDLRDCGCERRGIWGF